MRDLPESVIQLREWSAQLETTANALLKLAGEIQERLRSDPLWKEGDDAGAHRPAE